MQTLLLRISMPFSELLNCNGCTLEEMNLKIIQLDELQTLLILQGKAQVTNSQKNCSQVLR